jgi:hypothetical protein
MDNKRDMFSMKKAMEEREASQPKEEHVQEQQAPIPIENTDESNALAKTAAEAGVFLTSNNRHIYENFINRAKYGHQGAMPMKCKGTKCGFINMCPLHEAGDELPLGKRCPVEGALVKIWVEKHIDALDIDPNDPDYAVDMDMVYELAGLELIRNRAASHLSDDPELFKEKVVGYSPQGEPIYDDKPNLSLLILEKYGKRVDKLREQLLATRRSQAQMGRLASDNSVRAANMLKKAQELAERRRTRNEATDAEFEIKEDQKDDG